MSVNVSNFLKALSEDYPKNNTGFVSLKYYY